MPITNQIFLFCLKALTLASHSSNCGVACGSSLFFYLSFTPLISFFFPIAKNNNNNHIHEAGMHSVFKNAVGLYFVRLLFFSLTGFRSAPRFRMRFCYTHCATSQVVYPLSIVHRCNACV